jgi:hypothetical protein
MADAKKTQPSNETHTVRTVDRCDMCKRKTRGTLYFNETAMGDMVPTLFVCDEKGCRVR